MKKSGFTLLVVLLAAVAAAAASKPTLEIESPRQNATLQGNAVVIAFHTHNFKVVSLHNMVAPASGNPALTPAEESGGGEVIAPAPGPRVAGGGAMHGGMSESGYGGSMAPEPEVMEQSAAPQAPRGVNPHEGFVDVLVDNASFYFVHSSPDPILIAGLAPGRHQVLLRLVTADHHPVGEQAEVTLEFTIAARPAAAEHK